MMITSPHVVRADRQRIRYRSLPFCHLELRIAKPAPYGYQTHPKTLGQRIRKRRMDLGLLQQGLAQQLGVDVQAIRNWEADRTNPRGKDVPAIIAFLGYDPLSGARNLAERLHRYRLTHGLTQRQLAPMLGVDPSTIASGEKERHQPTATSVGRISRLLGA